MLHTGGSGYRRRSHLVHEQADEKDLQREVDDLKKRLRQVQRKQTPSSSELLKSLFFIPKLLKIFYFFFKI